MKFSWQIRVLLALASGAALALSFPNYNLWPLAWVAVGLLMLACLGAKPAAAALYGYLHGLVFYPVCLPWIDVVMRQYGGVDALTSAAILGLLAVAFALFPLVFGLYVGIVSKRNKMLACAAAPFVWVALEFLRGHLPIFSFPWNLTGYAATGSLPLLQVVTVTGVYGLSFLVVGFNCLWVYAILAGRQWVWKTVMVTTGVLILVASLGGHFVPQAQSHFVAHLVQTNFPQSESYPANWLQIHSGELDQLESISRDAARSEPGVVIWPETPAPFTFIDQTFSDRAVRIARESQNDFLVGVVDWKKDATGKWIATNTSTELDPTGRRIFTYDKIHLVPFGEYVPLRRVFSFAGRLTGDISDFTSGTTANVGNLPGGSFGVFICYEAIFASEVREFTLHGAHLLVNVSNDGWFGRSAAPLQHLMMARVRAVENRRWLLRDTNNGFTVDIDPYGRIVTSLATDIRGQLDAPYDFRSDISPYVRFGDWFAWLCTVAAVVFLIASFMRRDSAAKP
jgi:apolipoprotein N-acyltransferase